MAESSLVLSISIMCSGRNETTERCLSSLSRIRKSIKSELIITDTGCDSITREIVERYADKVIEFNWTNDFAEARNVGLEVASGEWFMYMDDDEYIENEMAIINFFNEKLNDEFDTAYYIVRSYLDLDCNKWVDNSVQRLFKKKDGMQFVGKIHEYVKNAGEKSLVLKSYVGHSGYAFSSEEDRRKHSERNVKLLKQMMQQEPDEPRWYYQISQEYSANKEYKNLLDMTRMLLQNDSINIKYRNSFICGQLLSEEQLNMDNALLQHFEEAFNDKSINPIVKAKLCTYVAKTFYLRGEFPKCEEISLYYLKRYEEYSNDFDALVKMGGFFIDDAFNNDNYNIMVGYIICIEIKKQNYDSAKVYYEKLIFDKYDFSINTYLPICLIEKMCDLKMQSSIEYMLRNLLVNDGVRNLFEELIMTFLPQISENAYENIITWLNQYFDRSYLQVVKEKYPIYREMYFMEEKILAQVYSLREKGELTLANTIQEELEQKMLEIVGVSSLH